jgi:N-acetylglucosamine-6-phosphate deacetylase
MGSSQQLVRQAVLADRIFDGRRWHAHAAVLIENGRIVGLAPRGDVPSDWTRTEAPPGTMLVPGFIDLQVNGGGGVLLNDAPTPDAMRAIARAHRRLGTTALLPTLITDTGEQMQTAIASARAVAGSDGVLGLHLEGPFISPARPGVHRKDRILQADIADIEKLHDLPGRSMITLAPECVPSGFVRTLAGSGARVSVGHSEASADVVLRAVEEGLTGVTHLYNAMPPLMGRSPGIAGAALSEPRLVAGLIADGIHVDPVSIRAAFAAKGADAIALVSDAMPTVGSDRTCFELLGRTVILRDGKLTAEDGTIAGAHLDMASAVRTAARLAGISLDDALRAATLTPARFLGLESERGALVPGAHADLVSLDAELAVVSVWAGGERVQD